jgi:GTPase SAR1 family protein
MLDATKNIICIMGPDGSGKTILCNLLLKKYDFQVLEIGKDILTNDNIKTMIDNFANNTTIEHYLFKKRKIVFIDDLDVLLCVDRNLLSKISSINKILKKKKISVLITCNSGIDKKLFTDTEAEVFKLTYPSCKDSFSYIMNKLDDASVDYDMEHLLEVVTKFKGNIRESVLNINNSTAELESISVERSFKDMNNFEVAKHILSNSSSCKEIDHLIRGDVGNLPYILYENLPIELDANYKTKDMLDIYMKVNSHFVDAVEFDEHAYASVDWCLLQYANVCRTKSICSILQGLEQKANQKNLTYKFSQMRSKSSHKKILGKKVKVASQTMQSSENSLIVATDALVRSGILGSLSKRKQKDEMQDLTCLVSTYEKYFT